MDEKDYKVKWYMRDWLLLMIIITSVLIGYYGIVLLLYVILILPKKRKDEEKYYRRIREREERKIIRKAQEEERNIVRRAEDNAGMIVARAEKEKEELEEQAINILSEIKEDILDCKGELDYQDGKLDRLIEKVEQEEETLQSLEGEVVKAVDKLHRLKTVVDGIILLDESLPGLINSESIRKQLREYKGFYGRVDLDRLLPATRVDVEQVGDIQKRVGATRRELNRVYREYNQSITDTDDWALYMSILLGIQSGMLITIQRVGRVNVGESLKEVENTLDKYKNIIVGTNEINIERITLFLYEVEPLLKNLVGLEYRYIKGEE